MSTVGWWTIASRPWNALWAIDEFGAGTLDGNPADGPSYDGCSAAVQENISAAYETRPLLYTNIGAIRAAMIKHGNWDSDANGSVSNPRTSGATLEAIANEIARPGSFMQARGYMVGTLVLPSGAVGTENVLDGPTIHDSLQSKQAVIYFVRDAQMLSGNEQGVLRHFVAAAGYGGDRGTVPGGTFDANGYGKVYILNSDIAGQHGTATGQWMWINDLAAGDVIGYAVIEPPVTKPPAPPSPPVFTLSINGVAYPAHRVEVNYG